jgi:hypothetical protein
MAKGTTLKNNNTDSITVGTQVATHNGDEKTTALPIVTPGMLPAEQEVTPEQTAPRQGKESKGWLSNVLNSAKNSLSTVGADLLKITRIPVELFWAIAGIFGIQRPAPHESATNPDNTSVSTLTTPNVPPPTTAQQQAPTTPQAAQKPVTASEQAVPLNLLNNNFTNPSLSKDNQSALLNRILGSIGNSQNQKQGPKIG